MFGAEFCLQYTLASQLLIKTCCLRCATAPAIHLFPSLSSYSSHTVPRYRITDRFILNMKELHTVGKKLCLCINYSSAFLPTKSHFNALSEIIVRGRSLASVFSILTVTVSNLPTDPTWSWVSFHGNKDKPVHPSCGAHRLLSQKSGARLESSDIRHTTRNCIYLTKTSQSLIKMIDSPRARIKYWCYRELIFTPS